MLEEGSMPKLGIIIRGWYSYLLQKLDNSMEVIDLILMWLSMGADNCAIGEPVEAFLWIPAAIGAIASGVGAFNSAKANKRNARKIAAMENENRQDYLREYYRGALDNEGSRAYLKKLDERMKRSDKAIENSLASQGATHENALAAKQANNEVYSEAVSNLVENEQARKDAATAQYKQGQNSLAQAQMQQNANEAATWSQVGNAISSAAQGLGEAGVFDNLGKATIPTTPLAKDMGKGVSDHLPKPQLPKFKINERWGL
jgi:hypothetical protein